MLPNASYFAFTATPKNKTLEIFGEPYAEGGEVKHRPFHSYTMKQAIQEGFILDVLENYTPVESYYRLVKTVEDDPEFDVKQAQKKLRRYVEGHDHAIRQKAEIMVDHFHDQVIAKHKIGGQARAMVVTSGIERAIEYFHAISAYLQSARARTRHRRLLRRARVRGREGHRSHRSMASRATTSPTRSRRTRTASSSAPTSSRPATTNRCCTRCTWTSRCPAQGGPDALAAEPRAPAEARHVRARLRERRRHHRDGVRGLLPDDDPERGNRSRTSCTT